MGFSKGIDWLTDNLSNTRAGPVLIAVTWFKYRFGRAAVVLRIETRLCEHAVPGLVFY